MLTYNKFHCIATSLYMVTQSLKEFDNRCNQAMGVLLIWAHRYTLHAHKLLAVILTWMSKVWRPAIKPLVADELLQAVSDSLRLQLHTAIKWSVVGSLCVMQKHRKQNWSGQARYLWSEWIALLCCVLEQFGRTATAVSLMSLLAWQYTLQGVPIPITRDCIH